jgi:prepilin-type N-terminal cleavage/methylation domain-containing protein
MKRMNKGSRRGFSLVELLAVVLILAVLAGVAIPLYINSRKSSAARACKANLASLGSMEAAFSTRNGQYTTVATAGSSAYDTATPTAAPVDLSVRLRASPAQSLAHLAVVTCLRAVALQR